MQSICVFCGSSSGHNPAFEQAASRLGAEIARRGWSLVYGGAHIGLMGALADSTLEHGGKVFGVIPEHLAAYEIAHTGLTKLEIVPDMHTRKLRMSQLADCFVALPGGIGTLEELFEAFVWLQLGIHNKPCGLLNTAGFYDDLQRFLQGSVEAGLLRREQLEQLLVADQSAELLDRLSCFQPSFVNKLENLVVTPKTDGGTHSIVSG